MLYKKTALSQVKRNIERNKGEGDESANEEMKQLSERAKQIGDFLSFTQNAAKADWAEYSESFGNMSKVCDLSKPHVLRALDASHRTALLFDDDEAVCETMKPKS